MSDLLHEIKKYVDGVKKLNHKIEEETIKAFKEKYDSILMKGFEDSPPPQNLEIHTGKKGSKHKVTQRICLIDFQNTRLKF